MAKKKNGRPVRVTKLVDVAEVLNPAAEVQPEAPLPATTPIPSATIESKQAEGKKLVRFFARKKVRAARR